MSPFHPEWTEKLANWRSSGLSIAAWCREHHEGYHRFRYWRQRLEGPVPATSGRFVEIKLDPSPLTLECNGVFIHLSPGFDPELLTEILALLKRV
jgi:hypothetical protein